MVSVRKFAAVLAAAVLALAVMMTGASAASASSSTSAEVVNAKIILACSTSGATAGDYVGEVRLENKKHHKAAVFLLSATGHQIRYAESFRVAHRSVKHIPLEVSRSDFGGNRVVLEVQRKNGDVITRLVIFFTNCHA